MPEPPEGYIEVTGTEELEALSHIDADNAWLPTDVGDPDCPTIQRYRKIGPWYIWVDDPVYSQA